MGIRDDVLALAAELEGVSLKDDCESCLASGTSLCRGDLECAESAHKACAKRLREIVEHDECEVTTVSAYDLLPEEDREAIAWVREQGGLDHVKAEWRSRVPYDRYERRRKNLLSHIAECEAALGRRRDAIARIASENDALRLKSAQMRLRLMPEGIEWPTVDGKPVDFVTGYEPSLGVLEAVSIYSNGACEVMGHDGIIKDVKEIHVATPKVLDADGAEICVGDTVYHVKDGSEMTVNGIDGEWLVVSVGGRVRHDIVTHRAPVLAADGRPLRVGETVWDVESGIEYEVVCIHTDEDTPARVMRTDGSHLAKAAKPSTLTHQRPDSWERLEHDAEKTVCEYFGANYDCANCPLETARCAEEVKKDIIRRAKKLAERGE